MRTYWDTSAAINAAISPDVFRRLNTGEHVARLHLLAAFNELITRNARHFQGLAENVAWP